MNKYFVKLIFPLGILLISIFFFLPFLLGGTIPYVGDFTGSDLADLNLPFRFLASQSLKSGEIPLWTDLLSSGFPLLAEGQAGVFYPFNILLYILLPFGLAVNLSFIINFFLGGLFTYIFSRSLKISQWGSLFSAIGFSLSGFFIFRLKHINLINAAIWLPLLFYLVDKSIFSKNKKIIFAILIGLIISIQFFAGHVQVTYISLVSIFLYFIFRLLSLKDYKLKNKVNYTLLIWVVAGIVAFGVSAIQFFPSYEYFKATDRQNWVSYEAVTQYSYHPGNFLSFINPYFYGNPANVTYIKDIRSFGVFWENNIYFGILSLIFALLAILFLLKRRIEVRIFFALLGISFLFSLGSYNPLFYYFWKFVPGFDIFRFPQRFLLLSILSLSLLSGFGFDYFIDKLKNLLTRYIKSFESMLRTINLLSALFVIILVIDLYVMSINYLGILDDDIYFSQPPIAQYINSDVDNFRIMSMNWGESWTDIYKLSDGWLKNLSFYFYHRNIIPPNLNVFWDIASNDDRSLFEGGLGGVQEFSQINSLSRNNWSYNSDSQEIIFTKKDLSILGLQNVKYLLSYIDINQDDGLFLVKEQAIDFLPSIKVYQNKYFTPRVKIFSQAVVKDPNQILEYMFSPDFDYQSMLVLEKNIELENLNVKENISEANIVLNQEKRVVINAELSQRGFLYFSHVFFPGWYATIDGVPVDILRANHAFMAVPLDQGKHEIEFFYKPKSFIIGYWVSFVSVVLLIIFFLFNFRKITKV